MPKGIPSQDTATRPPVVHVAGHQAPFGAILGSTDTVDRVQTGKTRVKGTPPVARVDPVPRHGHRTPPAPILEPSGSACGRLRAKLDNERTPQAENVHNGARQDPSDSCLGSRDRSGGTQNLRNYFVMSVCPGPGNSVFSSPDWTGMTSWSGGSPNQEQR